MRIGIGQDSHPFDQARPLILGGIEIEGHPGLRANSDGDVIFHALCNALSSSVGKGSLSTYADRLCQQGITDSQEYLKIAHGYVKAQGYKVVNVSIAIEGKAPPLEKEFSHMKRRISSILGIAAEDIGLTVTSGERLTAFGKGEGIQAIAAVIIDGA